MADRRLLVSDLDGTLLGDPAALDRFARWLADERDGFVVAYATGRDLASVQAAVRDEGLPVPDAILAAVGTEMYDGAGRDWPGWSDRFDGSHHERVKGALAGLDWLIPQEATYQSGRKASFDAYDLTDARRAAVERSLAATAVAATLVYSGNRYLDIVPSVAGKGPATRFLADALGIPHGDVLTFGDSGNDLDMLDGGFRGTMVANALPELVALAAPEVYRSPASYADGVLDGIRHWSAVPATQATAR